MLPTASDDPFYQFKLTFFEECEELLASMEQHLADIEEGNHDSEVMNAIFRVVHSIKAGAGAFNFERMVSFTHRFENLLDKLRSGDMEMSDEILRVLYDSNDILVDLVTFAREGQEAPQDYGETELSDIQALLGEDGQPAAKTAPAAKSKAAPAAQQAQAAEAKLETSERLFEIDFYPKPALFEHANEPLLIIRELSGLGQLKSKIDYSDLPNFHSLEPQKSYFSWSFELITKATRDDIDEVFEFVVDDCDLTIVEKDYTGTIQSVDVTTERPANSPHDHGYFLSDEELEKGIYSPRQADNNSTALDDDDDDAFGFFAPLETAPAVAAPAADDDDDAFGLFEPEMPVAAADEDDSPETEAVPAIAKTLAPKAAPNAGLNKDPMPQATSVAKVSSIRVDIDRVDRLVNMVGEIVITHSMLAQELALLQESRQSLLGSGIEEMSMHIRELQDNVMAIRMQPVKSVFSRMPKIVRDVAKKLGKQVKLITEGENTEVDKTVVEELADPLTHMIRNSMDHGLEFPDERIAAGKNPEGHILLSAEHRGGRIVITVADDGRGINREKVLELAIKRGIVDEGQNLSDEDIDNLIFAPGFSTAEKVTDLSGRGVGMDVVRRNIQSLGGRVSVVSAPGKGSRFQLTLPLTLAVLDGMVVGVGGQKYVIPINNIIETLRPTKKSIGELVDGTRVIHVRGEYIRLVEVSQIFDIECAERDPSTALVVLVEADGDRTIGIVVDALYGQQQVVIKSLETNYGRVDGIASATILGNGSVCLILDIDGLADMDSSDIGRQPITKELLKDHTGVDSDETVQSGA